MSQTATSRTLHILQGDCKVSSRQEEVMSTILGSCVSACMFDLGAGVGGMNHFLLPDAGTDPRCRSYGAYAMETLINSLMKAGARRDKLQAKVFGGARMISGMYDIGAKNAKFVTGFLAAEGIPIVGQSLGGQQARRIKFWPVTGAAKQRFTTEAPVKVEPVPVEVVSGGEVDLF